MFLRLWEPFCQMNPNFWLILKHHALTVQMVTASAYVFATLTNNKACLHINPYTVLTSSGFLQNNTLKENVCVKPTICRAVVRTFSLGPVEKLQHHSCIPPSISSLLNCLATSRSYRGRGKGCGSRREQCTLGSSLRMKGMFWRRLQQSIHLDTVKLLLALRLGNLFEMEGEQTVRLTWTHLMVGGVRCEAPSIAHLCRKHTRKPPEAPLCSPETSHTWTEKGQTLNGK